jgi:hypothetical protein
MIIYIQLTIAGADAGPFDLYSNLDLVTPFATGVLKSTLLIGSTFTVTDGTTSISVISDGICTNTTILSELTTTTTSTTTSTTTTITCTLIGVASEGSGFICATTINSTGTGVTEVPVTLSPSGGTVIMDVNMYNTPDKLEIIHNGIKKATTGMTVTNAGPFDNLYGSPTIPTLAQTLGTNQFIGTLKGAIPGRDAAFITDTGIVSITRVNQQLVWWTYTPADYAISNMCIIRITSPAGAVWDILRQCDDVPVTTSTTSSTTTTTTTQYPCCYEYYYNGYSALRTGSQSLANTNWRVATRGDWTQIYSGLQTPDVSTYVNMGEYKATDDLCINWISPNTGASNTFGLNILPVGYRNNWDGSFVGINTWCAYSYGNVPTDEIDFNYTNADATSGTNGSYSFGNPVRLVSDAPGIPNGTTGTYLGNDGKIYGVVAINELWVLTENIKETLYRDGSPITKIIGNVAWTEAITEAYCIYNDELLPCYSTTTTTTSSTTTTTTTAAPTTTTTSSTTTSTTTVIVPSSSILIVNNLNPPTVYIYHPDTNVSNALIVTGGTAEYKNDIAHTVNKLWLTGFAGIDEWDITLSPWSATHTRLITDCQFSAGLCAQNDTTLIGVRFNGNVYEENITTIPTVDTLKFTMSPNRNVAGDYIVTTDNKFIVLTLSVDETLQYITQFNYLTGALEIDLDITIAGNAPFGLFEYSSVIYIARANGLIQSIDTTYPYALTSVNTAGLSINGASQLASLLDVSLQTTTTTTTTTIAP